MLPEKELIFKKKKIPSSFLLSPLLLLAINANRFMWLVCRELCLTFLMRQQTKNLGNTALLFLSNLFSQNILAVNSNS